MPPSGTSMLPGDAAFFGHRGEVHLTFSPKPTCRRATTTSVAGLVGSVPRLRSAWLRVPPTSSGGTPCWLLPSSQVVMSTTPYLACSISVRTRPRSRRSTCSPATSWKAKRSASVTLDDLCHAVSNHPEFGDGRRRFASATSTVPGTMLPRMRPCTRPYRPNGCGPMTTPGSGMPNDCPGRSPLRF